MDMVERVALALLNSESGGTLAWDDLCLTDRTAFKRDAKAAIRAMLEGLEPYRIRSYSIYHLYNLTSLFPTER